MMFISFLLLYAAFTPIAAIIIATITKIIAMSEKVVLS